MFLIEFDENQYIDAERINYLDLSNGKVRFTLAGESDAIYLVDKVHEKQFIDNLDVLNQGRGISSRYKHINNQRVEK
jgi:ABC-type amino acid transport substrate-binding protein